MSSSLILLAAIFGVALGRPEVYSNPFIHHGGHAVSRHGNHVINHLGIHASPHHGSNHAVHHPVHHHLAPHHDNSYHQDHHAPAHSAFDYAVHDDYSGNHFGHTESRDGYTTRGSYFVHLPDGRVQTVSYYADQSGYHPTVSYSGTAHHPAHHAPAYHASAYHAPANHAPVYYVPATGSH